MKDSLLVALRNYPASLDRDPLEDFITEAFRWLLSNHASVADVFLNEISTRTDKAGFDPTPKNTKWATQETFPKSRPDMIAEAGEMALVFEHKVHAAADHDQLMRHNEGLKHRYPTGLLVLITSASWHYTEPADVKMTWKDVYQCLDNAPTDNNEATRMVVEFLALLDTEGLGPREHLEEPQLRALTSHQETLDGLSKLIKEIKAQPSNWAFAYDKLPDLEGSREPGSKWSHNPPRYGRISLILYTEGNINIHFGILIDPSDINTGFVNDSIGPDIAVHLKIPWKWLSQKQYDRILRSDAYTKLVSRLNGENLGDWTLFEITSDNSQNKHHPVVLQKPLAPVLRGTASVDDQRQVLTENLQDGVRMLLEGGEIGDIRERLLRQLDS